jgi:hypothetical protein
MLNIGTPSSPFNPNLGCAVHSKSDPIEAGKQAWARLQDCETWEDWKLVGGAITAGREHAMRAAQTNKPEGSHYNKEFGAWLRVRGFADLEATTRKRLLQCMENIAAIETWRETLEVGKRLKWNHPATVLSAWKRATTESKPKPEKPDLDPDWGLFFRRFTLKEWLARIPPEWREELLTRRDNLDRSKPDPKVAAAIKAALSHLEAANDPKSGKTIAASNEHAALNDLRGALRVLAGLDRTLHDVEIRLVKKQKRAA